MSGFCDANDEADNWGLRCSIFITFIAAYSLIITISFILYFIYKYEISKIKHRRITDDRNMLSSLKIANQNDLSSQTLMEFQDNDMTSD